MRSLIALVFSTIPLSIHSMDKQKPILMTGMQNVVLATVVPQKLTQYKAFDPQNIQEKLFAHLDSVPYHYDTHNLVGTYPPLIKAWFAAHITTAALLQQARPHISWFRHPILYKAAETGFNLNKAPTAFKSHRQTHELLQACKLRVALALCANLHPDLHTKLKQTFPDTFALFDYTYISGEKKLLASDKRFYQQIVTEDNTRSCFFIDCDAQTIAAAKEAGIPKDNVLTYNCNSDDPEKLKDFLQHHNLMPTTP